MESLLHMAGVHTHIGAYHILHGVDLQVPKGQLTMLLGRNGAGKTTTLRTMMGLWTASQGAVTFAGQDITKMTTPDIAMLGIAYVPEAMGIFSDLTVKENMLLAARSAKRAANMDDTRLKWIFKLFPAVEKFWNHPAGKLSGGQKQMVAVARAIVEPRQLLIVDEPSKGLAPSIINNMIDAFAELKRQVASLQRDLKSSSKPAKVREPEGDASPGSQRFSAKGLKSLRAKLGLSAAEFGQLVGASGQSIYKWEAGKAVPRASQRAALVAMRGIGKREAAKRLASMQ